MTVLGDIQIPAEEFVLGRALAEVGDYRAELAQFVPLRDQFVPHFWIEDDDPTEVAATLRDQPRVASVTRYDGCAGRTLYELTWTGPIDDFLSILMEQDILIDRAGGTSRFWNFTLLASDHEEISDFQQGCLDNDIPIEVQSVSQTGLSALDSIDPTAKQREVLELAFDMGYFSVPRETTMTDLGAELDISQQAASKRLRRAMESITAYLLTESE